MIGNDDSNHIDPNASVGDFSTKTSSTPEPNDIGEMLNVGQFLFGEGPDMLSDNVEETVALENRIRSAHDSLDATASTTDPMAKRIRHNEKLKSLGQDVLDRIYDEHAFNADPRFAEVNKLIASGEPNIENMDEGVEVMKRLQESGHFIEYITKSLKLPQERIAAVTRYVEYRDMVEDFS